MDEVHILDSSPPEFSTDPLVVGLGDDQSGVFVLTVYVAFHFAFLFSFAESSLLFGFDFRQ